MLEDFERALELAAYLTIVYIILNWGFIYAKGFMQAMKEDSRITENYLLASGFKLTETYDHDGFTTRKYGKGIIKIETTHRGDELITRTIKIEEIKERHIDNSFDLFRIKQYVEIVESLKEYN